MANNLQGLIAKGFSHSVADTTRRKLETSVKHWIEYTELELRIPSLLTHKSFLAYGLYSVEEMANRRLIILGYVAKMVTGQGKGLRKHEKEDTIKEYVQQINFWHNLQAGQPLLPDMNYRSLMFQITKVARGLVKFNQKIKWKRRGLRGKHVKSLNDYTMSEWLNEEIDFAGARVKLTHALICNINALRAFAWQQVCRLGEATTVNQEAWTRGDTLEIGKRPSRAHVSGDRVDHNSDGTIYQFRIPAFQLKCDGIHSDTDYTIPVQEGPDIQLDAGTELVQMLCADRVDLDLETTPLFRFPPGCSVKYSKSRKATIGGSDPFANRTLNAAFLTHLDRLIMSQHPLSFDGLLPLNIGGHSYRIGGCTGMSQLFQCYEVRTSGSARYLTHPPLSDTSTDLFAAGAPAMLLQAMGRYVQPPFRNARRNRPCNLSDWTGGRATASCYTAEQA